MNQTTKSQSPSLAAAIRAAMEALPQAEAAEELATELEDVANNLESFAGDPKGLRRQLRAALRRFREGGSK
jgi:hypothetical protein